MKKKFERLRQKKGLLFLLHNAKFNFGSQFQKMLPSWLTSKKCWANSWKLWESMVSSLNGSVTDSDRHIFFVRTV